MYQRILVPTDGTDLSMKAADAAIALAQHLGSQIFAISVKEPFPYSALAEIQPISPEVFLEAQEKLAIERVRAIEKQTELAQVACRGYTMESVHPWEAILQAAKAHDCDLIVMASHGRKGVAALLLGSETHRVLTHGALPVLVVR